MMSDRKLATMRLNAVWNEDVRGLRRVLRMGADPNWIFNGYPILIHAVFTRNEKIMMLLIKAGAVQVEEALGFALDRCVGEMIFPLAFLGIVPKEEEVKEEFGPYPSARLSASCTSIDGRNYETMCCLYPYASAFAFPRVYDARGAGTGAEYQC